MWDDEPTCNIDESSTSDLYILFLILIVFIPYIFVKNKLENIFYWVRIKLGLNK